MKRIKNTRFGSIEYDNSQTLFFVDGLIGFAHLHEYIVMPGKEDSLLFWIQSVDDPEVAFILMDPTNFFFDYQVALDKNDRIKLHLDTDDPSMILAVVTVQPDRSVTLNLAAPVLFNPKKNLAAQVVLENSPFSTRTPLPQSN